MCISGSVLTLLVGIAVNREFQKVGADAAVIEQGITLAGVRRTPRYACPRAWPRSETRAARA